MLYLPSTTARRFAGGSLILLAGLAFARPWLDAVPFEAFMLGETLVLVALFGLGVARLLPFGRLAAAAIGTAAVCAFLTYGDLAWWHLPLLWDIAPLAAVALLLGTGVALLVRPVPKETLRRRQALDG